MKKFLIGSAICMTMCGCNNPPATDTPKPSKSPVVSTTTTTTTSSPAPTSTVAISTATATPTMTGTPAATPSAPAQWETFKAPDGTFSVSLPGKAKTETGADGTFTAVAEYGSAERIFGVSRHPNDKHIKKLTEAQANQMLEVVGKAPNKVINHALADFQGNSALNVEMVMGAQNEHADMLFVFTDKYMYQLMILHPVKDADFSDDDKKRFGQSFKIESADGAASGTPDANATPGSIETPDASASPEDK